jgi:hypothetical protein
MAYVGTPIDTINQFQSLQGKRFSGDGSTTAFTLDIAPSSVFDIEVFVENVRQDPNSAYGISGTTLTFTGAPPSGTNNIYVVHQAKAVGTIDVPASGVVPASLASNIISGQTALAAKPADTDEFLVSDAGTIKRIDYSLIKDGITMVDQFRLTANYDIPTSEGSITSNLERSDSRGAASFGSIQMSESSGIFTFPSTGFYLIIFTVQFYTSANNGNLQAHIKFTSDNSTYLTTGYIQQSTNANQSLSFGSGAVTVLLDITDTSNQKVKFNLGAGPSGTPGVAQGDTDRNETTMMFIRIGDT